MMRTIPLVKRVKMLLSSLEAEHYARRALLRELCDELAGQHELALVRAAAAKLLLRLGTEELADDDYERAILEIARRFEATLRVRSSGTVTRFVPADRGKADTTA